MTIDRAYLYNGQVHIYGDSFTKWSKVYVNGKSVPTGYESGQCLTVSADDMKNGDHFVVNQVGSGNTIFRTSNEFTFNDPAYESGKEAADPSDSTGGIPTGD